MLAYCDFISDRIHTALVESLDEPLTHINSVGNIEWDLHPEDNYLVSTKKTMKIWDQSGKEYLITVEET